MEYTQNTFPQWLTDWMKINEINLWGIADLKGFYTPEYKEGCNFPIAISFAVPMNPEIMASIQKGPNQAYADEWLRANNHIEKLSDKLTQEFIDRGYYSTASAASYHKDFPHKTAATRAGLGWIGKNCQLITRRYGPWLRLGTVFTTMDLHSNAPIEKSYCGSCRRCVDSCPSHALQGNTWYPGLEREKILDADTCFQWTKEHNTEFHNVHELCGICSGVCPHGLKLLKNKNYSED